MLRTHYTHVVATVLQVRPQTFNGDTDVQIYSQTKADICGSGSGKNKTRNGYGSAEKCKAAVAESGNEGGHIDPDGCLGAISLIRPLQNTSLVLAAKRFAE